MVAPPKPAATVVLMRDRPGDGAPEVLLLERHRQSLVGAGAFVFPGGVVEAADRQAVIERLSPGFSAAAAAQRMEGLADAQEALPYYAAAIRETLEEARVLLAEPPADTERALPTAAALDALREAVMSGEVDLFGWLAAQGLVLATRRLVYFAHWITPEVVPQRFTARFFLIEVPPGVEPAPDRREVTSHRWLTPAAAIALHERGDMHLMVPTVRNLELLGTFDSTASALRGLSQRTVRAILPKVRFTSDGTRQVVLPGDAAYDSL